MTIRSTRVGYLRVATALMLTLTIAIGAAEDDWILSTWSGGTSAPQVPFGLQAGVSWRDEHRVDLAAWSGPDRRHRWAVQGPDWQRQAPDVTFALETAVARLHLNHRTDVPLCSVPWAFVWELRSDGYVPTAASPVEVVAAGERMVLIGVWQHRHRGLTDSLPAWLRWLPETLLAGVAEQRQGTQPTMEWVDLPYAGWVWRVPAGRSLRQALEDPANRLVDARSFFPESSFPRSLGLLSSASGPMLWEDVDGDGRAEREIAIPWPSPLVWPAGSGRSACWSLPPQPSPVVVSSLVATVRWSGVSTMPRILLPQQQVTASEDVGVLAIPIRIDSPQPTELSIGWQVLGDPSASSLASIVGEALIPAGETEGVIEIVVRDDSLHGDAPPTTLAILATSGVLPPDDPRIVVTILDDDPMPTLVWHGVAPEVREGDGTVVLLAGLTHPTRDPVGASIEILGEGLALIGDGLIVLPAGETMVEVSFAVADDAVYADQRTVSCRLTAQDGASVADAPPAIQEVVITEDDPLPAVTLDAGEAVIAEGETTEITIRRIGACALPIQVTLALEGMDAEDSLVNADMAEVLFEVVIPADQEGTQIALSALADGLAEGDERGLLRIHSRVIRDGLFADAGERSEIEVRLLDADPVARVGFVLASSQTAESQGVVRIEVASTLPSGKDLLVDYAFDTQGAITLQDLTAGRIRIPAGETAAAILLRPNDDLEATGPSLVAMRLTDVAGGEFGDQVLHDLSIRDDETPRVSTAWHALARTLIARRSQDPPTASRCLAILGSAQRWALAGLPADAHVAPAARVTEASRQVLAQLYPLDAAEIEALASSQRSAPWWATALGEDPQGPDQARTVADLILARRSADGHNLPWTGSIPVGPEYWYPSWEEARPPQRPEWAAVTPWFLLTADQFRPGPPPAPGTPAFAEAIAEVRQIADTRSAAQLAQAGFWTDGPGTATPPGHWNAIACQAIEGSSFDERASVRCLAVLGAGLMDAGIATWDCKYTYWSIRPYQVDPAITTPTGQPNFPSYVSGHSTFSGCASHILGSFFPAQAGHFQVLAEAAAESRLLGGIHYRFDNDTGLVLGRAVGAWALQDDEDGQWREDVLPLLRIDAAAIDAQGLLTAEGLALPGPQAPLTSVRAWLDDHRGDGPRELSLVTAPAPEGGLIFSLSESLPVADGRFTLDVLAATDLGTARARRSLRFDPDGAPQLAVTSPSSGARFPASASITLTGQVDQALRRLLVMGAEVPVSADGDGFSFSVDLAVEHLRQSFRPLVLTTGINRIDVLAEDYAGNVVEVRHEIEIDGDAPLLIVEAPGPDEVLVEDTVTLVGSVRDTTLRTGPLRAVAITVDGEAVDVIQGTFTATVAVPEEGEHEVEVVATDDVGNQRILRRTLRRSDALGLRARLIGPAPTGAAGAEIASPIEIEVVDAQGRIVPQQVVTVRVVLGDGEVAEAPDGTMDRSVTMLTDDQGRCRFRWRLGGRGGLGTQQVLVSVQGGIQTLRIDAVAGPGAISQILVVDGDLQTVAVGTWAGESLQIRVVDAFNNPLPDVPIDWAIVRGEADLEGAAIGPLGGATQVTDGWGRCRLDVRPRLAGDLILEARVDGSEIPARFHLLARVPDPSGATSLEGEIVDDAGRPLSGVTVLVDGSTLGSVSDREGRFRVTGIRPGHRHLIVVGGTRGRGGTYLPTLGFELEVARGVVNQFPGRIAVPALDDSQRVWVGGDEVVRIPMPGRPGWFIEVEPHATIRADGHRGPVEMWLAPVQPSASPMPLPAGERAAMLATLQPPGVRFDPPATVVIPNDLGAPRGADLELRSYDHDLGDWVTTGWARVNERGTSIATVRGSGIVKSGWHTGVVPASVVQVWGQAPDLTAGGGLDEQGSGPDGQDAPPNGLTVDIDGKLRATLWRKAVCVARVQARSGTAEWSWNMMPTETPLGAIVAPEDPSGSPKQIEVSWSRPSRDAEDLALVRLAARSGSAMDEQILEIQVDPPGTDPHPAIVVPGQRTRLRMGPVPDLPKEELPILHWRATADLPLTAGVRVDEDLTSPRPPEAGPAVPSTGKIGIVASTVVTVGGLPHLDLDLEIAPDLPPGVIDVSFTGHGIAPALWIVGTVPITLSVPPIAECLPKRMGTWDEPVIILDADASLVGTVEGNQDRWRLRARATGADQIQWDLGSGFLLRGTRTSPEIVVRYPPGHHVPTLVATKTLDGRTYTRHAAIHHLVVTKDRTAEDWRPVSGPVSDPYGSPSKAARAPGGDDLPKASIPIWLEASPHVRLSEDGYPQNEYWLGDLDLGTSPRLVRIAPRGEVTFHVQGYGEPSQAVDDATVLAQASRLPGPAPLDTAEVSTVVLEVGVDLNGDHAITFGPEDRTSVERPYRFWVNDDRDRAGGEWQDHLGPYSEEDDYQSGSVDSANDRIDVRRDLEDFSRMWVQWRSPQVLDRLLGPESRRYRIRVVRDGVGGLRCFPAVLGGGTGYLTDYRLAALHQIQQEALLTLDPVHTSVETIRTGVIPWLGQPDGTFRSSPIAWIWEAIAPGRASYTCRIDVEYPGHGWISLGRDQVSLDLRPIQAFYDHVSLGQTPGTVSPILTYDRRAQQGLLTDETSYILHVHGWNMEPWEKERFAETMYKRLWWNGYRGGFGMLTWPTYFKFHSELNTIPGIYDKLAWSEHFDLSEHTAWRSGSVLAQGLPRVAQALNHGQPIVLSGHSMGNIVVGNALQILPVSQRGKIQAFISCQAAVTAHVFDGSLPEPLTGFSLTAWAADGGPTTANVYRDVLGDLRSYRTYNFCNVHDYALSAEAWQINQALKPNNGYSYEQESTVIEPGPGFLPGEDEWHERWLFTTTDYQTRFHWRARVEPGPLPSTYFHVYPPDSRYRIMAFMSEPRIQAAGAVLQPWTDETRELERLKFIVDLQRFWPDYKPHRSKAGYISENDRPYSGHRWHSAQFRMTIAEQAAFWQTVLDKAFGGGPGYLPGAERGRDP